MLDRQYQVKLHQTNLTARKSKGKSVSVMDQLEAENLARRVSRGARGFWEVSAEGVERLAAIAAAARPGPPPGAQVTLDARQLAKFVAYLAQHPRPEAAVREAVFEATGYADGVDRVIIPVSPRRPASTETKEETPQHTEG